MKIIIDVDKNKISFNKKKVPLYSAEGFDIISKLYLKVGWDQKYVYSFSWLGRPIIQLPDDILRIQEVIYTLKPDVIIETGIAHGGSLILYASLCKAMGKGRIIGIDIEIRPHNRSAIEKHELFPYITLFEGNAVDPVNVRKIKDLLKPHETVLIILDSCHTYAHVSKELELYSTLVTPGSYMVVTDGSQEYLNDSPRAQREYSSCNQWPTDNPRRAALDFVKKNNHFEIVEPAFPFNEGFINFRVTHWPSAFVKRKI
ncbi:MAG: CmcI family methyltransferase [bacterium]